jgi:hypothetical protein
MTHRLLIRALKTQLGNQLWRRLRGYRGLPAGNYADLPELVRRYAPGRSFADIGCMWGVNGEYAFVAEEAGAHPVAGVDVFGPTPEFLSTKKERGSSVEFILGDVSEPEVLRQIGPTQVVLCAGVLYHHPAPFDLLVALRAICTETLIIRSSTIPESPEMKNMAVFWPGLSDRQRKLWDKSKLGVGVQLGVSTPFDTTAGYGNWFWGLTPSCFRSLVRLAGFEPIEDLPEPWAHTMVCRAVKPPFVHRVPSPSEAAALGEAVSRTGEARPQ